jgi:hypothetical protein
MGWRLAKLQELQTLKDTSPGGFLPGGHPFIGVSSGFYWTANTVAGIISSSGGFAWTFKLDWSDLPPDPLDINFLIGADKTPGGGFPSYWCCRGGSGYEDYPAP